MIQRQQVGILLRTPTLSLPSRREKLFVIVVLLLSTGAFTNLSLNPNQAPTDDVSGIGTLVTAFIYVITLFLLAKIPKFFSKLLVRQWPLLIIAAFTMASAYWSNAPAISFRHGVGLLFTFLFGLYLAFRYTLSDQLNLLVWVFGTCMVGSFVFRFFGLGTSVDARDGVPGWFGAFGQKNELGITMALSAIVFLLWRRVQPRHGWVAITGIIGSLTLVVLSQSVTAIIAAAVLLLILPALQWTMRRGVRWIVSGLILLAAFGTGLVLYAIDHFAEVTEMFGRNVTLTGRLPLWIFSAAIALQRPWFGHGYNAFWMQDEAAIKIQHAVHWMAPHAHNGFLELWLEIGLVGLGIFAAGCGYYFWRSLRFLLNDGRPEAAWPFLFLVFTFIVNLTGVTFLYRNSIWMVLYAAVASSAISLRLTEDRPDPGCSSVRRVAPSVGR